MIKFEAILDGEIELRLRIFIENFRVLSISLKNSNLQKSVTHWSRCCPLLLLLVYCNLMCIVGVPIGLTHCIVHYKDTQYSMFWPVTEASESS